MFENARAKNAPEYVTIAKEALDRRCAGWDKVSVRRGGANPTVATFQGKSREFPSTKEAYGWLIEQFIRVVPDIFPELPHETLKLGKGKRRNTFARSPQKLYIESPDLADKPPNYVRLPNGWYADVNLPNAQKFEILARLANRTALKYPEEWDLKVSEPTEALENGRQIRKLVEEIKREFLE